MLRLTVDIPIQRLAVAPGENCALQVTFLPELNPEPWLSLSLAETSRLPCRDSLSQLTVGHREAAVQVLRGHLVLVIESHSVRGAGRGGGGTFLLKHYLLRATTRRNVSSAASLQLLLLHNVCEGK